MGPEMKSKKRKAAATNDEVSKVKKVKQVAVDALPEKRKAVDGPDSTTFKKKLKVPKSSHPEGTQSTSAIKTRPTLTTYPTSNGTGVIPKKLKSSSDVKPTEKKVAEVPNGMDLNSQQTKSKKKDLTKSTHVEDDETAFTTDSSEEEEIGDQTEALLKGFESDDDDEKDSGDQGYKAGDEIPKVGQRLRKKAKKAAEKASTSGKPGVVYIGRIPHGFYEQEMRQYFSQFGSITNLRLSRNRKTGKSKHFAFIEFESAEVAEIVSKTMDNYLLFGHILKCKLVAPEQVHKDLWIGANKRFKSVPWNKIQGRRLSQAMMVEGWERKMAKEEKRRADKKAAMKLLDYDFESPELKSARKVLKQRQHALTKSGNDGSDEALNGEEPKKIEAPKEMEEKAMTTKNKMDKKQRNGSVVSTVSTAKVAEVLPIVTAEPSKNKRKNKKTKSSDLLVGVQEQELALSAKVTDASSVEKAGKVNKSKKHRTSVASVQSIPWL